MSRERSSSETSFSSTYSSESEASSVLDESFSTYPDGGSSDVPEAYLKSGKNSTGVKRRAEFISIFEDYDPNKYLKNTLRRFIVKPPFMALDDDEIEQLLEHIKDKGINIYAVTGVPKPVVTEAEFAARLAQEKEKGEDGLAPEQILATLEKEKFHKALRQKNYTTKEEFEAIKPLIADYGLKDKFTRVTEVPCLVDAFRNLSTSDFKRLNDILAISKAQSQLASVSPNLLAYIQQLTTGASYGFFGINDYQKATFNPLEVQEMIKILNANEATDLAAKIDLKRRVTMNELLGKEGVKAFQQALEEERDSEEFKKALWQHSVKTYDFEKPENTFLYLILSGVSGAGKSTSGKQAVERELKKMGVSPTEKGKGEVSLAWVDGGVARELNHMQKLVKYLCIAHGLEVTDLYSKSKGLDAGKKSIKKYVTQYPEAGIGLVIPETYSAAFVNEDLKTIKSIKEKLNTPRSRSVSVSSDVQKVSVAYDFVVGINIGRHPKIVKLMGDSRAFDPTTTQAANFKTFHDAKSEDGFLENIWNSFIQSIGLAENKAYGQYGYTPGKSGSLKYFLEFGDEVDKDENIEIKRYFNCNDIDVYDQSGNIWDFNRSEGKPVIASERLRADWKTKSPKDPQGKPLVTLAQYAKDNWRNYPNIMIEYNPGKLNLEFAPKLEETIKNTLKKNTGFFSALAQTAGSFLYNTFISPVLNRLRGGASKTEAEDATDEAEEDSIVNLDKAEQENLEFQLRLLKIFNDLQDNDAFNKPEEITKALKEVRKLEKRKFSEERLEVLDNFRTHNTLNLLVEARQMLEKRQELLLQLKCIEHQQLGKKPEGVQLEDPLKKKPGVIYKTLAENETLDNIFTEVKSINTQEDYDKAPYPDHIFSRLKILINKRFENNFKKANLKYLLALDRIVGQIDVSDKASLADGIQLINDLKSLKEKDEASFPSRLFRTKNQTTVPLIEEILEYYQERQKTLDIIFPQEDVTVNVATQKDLILAKLDEQLTRAGQSPTVFKNPKIEVILKHPALEALKDNFENFLNQKVPPRLSTLVNIISELAAKHPELKYHQTYKQNKSGCDLLELLNSQLDQLPTEKELNWNFSRLFSISIEVFKLKKEQPPVATDSEFLEIEAKLNQKLTELNEEHQQEQETIKSKEKTIREHQGLRDYLIGLIRSTGEEFEDRTLYDDLDDLEGMTTAEHITGQFGIIEENTIKMYRSYLLSQCARIVKIDSEIARRVGDVEELRFDASKASLLSIIDGLNQKNRLITLDNIYEVLSTIDKDVSLLGLVQQMITKAEENDLFKPIDRELTQTLTRRQVSLLSSSGRRSYGTFENTPPDQFGAKSHLRPLWSSRVEISEVEADDENEVLMSGSQERVKSVVAHSPTINKTIREHETLRNRLTTLIQDINAGLGEDAQVKIRERYSRLNLKTDLVKSSKGVSEEEIASLVKQINANTNELFSVYLFAQNLRIEQSAPSKTFIDSSAELIDYQDSLKKLTFINSNLNQEKRTVSIDNIYQVISVIANDVRLLDLVEKMMTRAKEKGLFQTIEKVSRRSADNLDQLQARMKRSSGHVLSVPVPKSELEEGRAKPPLGVNVSGRDHSSSGGGSPPYRSESFDSTGSSGSDYTTEEDDSSVDSEGAVNIPVLGTTTPPRSVGTLAEMLSNLDGAPKDMSVGKQPITLYSASGQKYQYQYVEDVASASMQELPAHVSDLDKQKLCLTIISMINNILLHHAIVEITTDDPEVQQYAKDYIAHFNMVPEHQVELFVNNKKSETLEPASTAFKEILKTVPGGQSLIPECVLEAREPEVETRPRGPGGRH